MGRGGADKLLTGAGVDEIFADRGADTLAGRAGRDRLFAGRGHDRLIGGDGRDRLHADDDDPDRAINCGAGNDIVFVDRGQDPKADPARADPVRGKAMFCTIWVQNVRPGLDQRYFVTVNCSHMSALELSPAYTSMRPGSTTNRARLS